MKNSLTLLSSANKYFSSLRDENDKPIYTYNDEFMRHFVRQSIKGVSCSALNQYYKSTISDEVFIIISKELNVNGNVCELIDKYFEYTNKHTKSLKNGYDSQIDYYRDINQEERTHSINNKLSKLTIPKNYKN